MTGYYIEYLLLPDGEFNRNHLLAALYNRLHVALVELREPTLGVSFPRLVQGGVSPSSLGSSIRVHGSESTIGRLSTKAWLGALRDHVEILGPGPVPKSTSYRVVRRIQTKSSPERLRRRLQRRHGLSEAEARERIPDGAAKFTTLPWIDMRSGSSHQKFRLFIEHGPLLEEPTPGVFNAYGLSSNATVPWF